MPKHSTPEIAAELSWSQTLAWRAQKQLLTDRLPGDAVLDVTSALCGLHAQVMSSAELTVWARTESPKRESVQKALWDDRSLVKLWAMRGTLHLVRADEYPIYIGALRTYDHYLKGQWTRYFGTTQAELKRMLDGIYHVLKDRFLTREQLAEAVQKRTRSPAIGLLLRQSWGSFLKPSSFRGHLCFGPNDGRNVTFTRPDTWIGPFEELDPREGLKELIRRFVGTYGPVTREAISRWWFGLTPAATDRLLGELGDEVIPVDVEGHHSWILASDLEAVMGAAPAKVVRLLPAFDQYVVTAPRDANAVLEPALKERVYRKAAWISQVLFVDGRMLGVWTHDRRKKVLEVAIEPFAKLPAWVRKGAEREAERLAAYYDAPLSVTWSD